MKEIRLSLEGEWVWRSEKETEQHIGHVPGSVLKDMLDSGLIEDPFWRENEYAVRDLFDRDYIYERDFTVPDEWAACDEADLVFEGLDTLADIELNGEPFASADDMHRTWVFPVKERLKPGANHIAVRLRSPLRFIREEDARNDIFYCSTGSMRGTAALRKAHCMFGWDWGPQLPDAGIFRPVYLRGLTGARMEELRFSQRHEAGRVTLTVQASLHWSRAGEALLRLSLTSPEGETCVRELCVCSGEGTPEAVFTVDSPRLWWPNGLGEQPLYTVTAELLQEGQTVHRETKRIGLRTIRLCTAKDEWGSEFAFEVNGHRIFGMGANYIPQDSLISRVTPEKARALIADCAAANMNMIRVWGGGYYQHDAFYDACDEYGILVWHDLMFSCNVYALDEAGHFEENITAETRDNVRRIRHHACLALWCGNNEMESGWYGWKRLEGHHPRYPRDYLIIFERILNRVVQECDGVTPWWPSSPSSGGAFFETTSPNRGDQHYWDVWHSGKPFTAYREEHFRFCSEYGFQSFPSMKTIRAFTLPEDRNIFSHVMESHQKNRMANQKIFTYVADYFRYPKDMNAIAYVSQLLQLKAIQYGVEYWRQNRGRCMGSLYWQLNDCWPVASWASLDYYGRWKALHYGARRFYAPRMASCFEREELSPLLSWYVHNDTLEAYDGYLTVELRDSRFGLLRRLETDVRAEPLSASCVLREDFSALLPDAETRRRVFCEYRLEVDGQVISRGTTLFAKPKHLDLPGVKYMAEVTERADDFDINLTADGFSYYTELDFHEWDAVFSDNYFDITRPEGVTVSVPRRFLPAGVTCDEVRAALTIRSVRDSYSPRED
ncbi:MAG: glycoside hydrolase family 2 protein [Clostridia bacterium]|nr:glycoside hydrolase family 2 protein [Clostridia bacterium]